MNSSASTFRSLSKQLNSGIFISKRRHKRSGRKVVVFVRLGVKVFRVGSEEAP